MARSDMGGVDSASLERPGAPVILSEAHSAQSKDIAQQWVESNPPAQPESRAGKPADSASLERLHSLLMDVLEATEYTRRHAANCDPSHIRRLVRRIGIDAVDAPVWMGIFRQVLWKLSK